MTELSSQHTDRLRFTQAVSTSADPDLAADEVADQLEPEPRIDLLQVFISAHHGDEAERIASRLRDRLSPGVMIGVTADAVVCGGREHERAPGIAALAARLPGVEIRGFAVQDLADVGDASDPARLRETMGAGPHLRASIVFVDPYSVPMSKLLPALNGARSTGPDGRAVGIIAGGVASGGGKAGQNALLLDGEMLRGGFVGVSLSGPVRVDAVVSQGCRPIGDNMVITKAKANVIYELGGQPALEAVTGVLDTLDMGDRRLLKRGLFVGRVVSEYKDHYGRGDYLVRNVAGVNPNSNIVAVHDLVRAGQTVRLHIRDAQAAAEDLELLLDAQKLYDRPAGVLMVTCTGRGRNLFDHPDHDAAAVQRAFRSEQAGAEKAKPGTVLDPDERGVPLAGFFAGGEIGPVGAESYLHGHSVCAVVFRE